MQVGRHLLPPGTPQQPPRVLVQLLFALLRVIQQYRTPFAVRFHPYPQQVGIRPRFLYRPGYQRGRVVAFSRAFAARDTEYIFFRAERYVPGGHDGNRPLWRMVVVDLAGFQHRHRVTVQAVQQFEEQPYELVPCPPGFEVVRHVLVRLFSRQG